MASAIHDRMPVILDRESYDLWLDPGMTDVQVVSELLKPYDARSMRCYLQQVLRSSDGEKEKTNEHDNKLR